MQYRPFLVIGILAVAPLLCAQTQNPPAPGIAPRATPADYQFHARAGTLTVAAEFTGHVVGTPEGSLTSEDYVVVEAAVFGSPAARTTLSAGDFSLRLNGKKPVAAEPYGLVVSTLRDFESEPTAAEQKEKTAAAKGGNQTEFGAAPPPYRVPDAMRIEWRRRLQRTILPEGDRGLPQAGLLYFPYRGKTEKLQSLELIYTGPAGKCTLKLR